MTDQRPTTDAGQWFDDFPVEDKLGVSDSGDVALVDIAGGLGQNIVALHTAHPELKGRLILQDLPQVIAAAKLPAAVKGHAHNFFSPQPVKGAKAYSLHDIFHDWPEKQASTILSHIREAMGPDSMLLIFDVILPEGKVP